MTNIARRIAAGAALLAAPVLIALGSAAMSHAEVSAANTGPSFSQRAQHQAFPQQRNAPQPGTSIHHHHQH